MAKRRNRCQQQMLPSLRQLQFQTCKALCQLIRFHPPLIWDQAAAGAYNVSVIPKIQGTTNLSTSANIDSCPPANIEV